MPKAKGVVFMKVIVTDCVTNEHSVAKIKDLQVSLGIKRGTLVS